MPKSKFINAKDLASLEFLPEPTPFCDYIEGILEIHLKGETNNLLYPIPLEELDTTAKLLDVILQVSGKGWCTPGLLKSFLVCLDQACRRRFGKTTQAVYCPGGFPKSVNWKKGSY